MHYTAVIAVCKPAVRKNIFAPFWKIFRENLKKKEKKKKPQGVSAAMLWFPRIDCLYLNSTAFGKKKEKNSLF